MRLAGRTRAALRAALVALVLPSGLGLGLGSPAPAAAEAPLLSLPVDCVPGTDCFVQNYVDVDPGPAYADFACGRMSYDGHEGTDIRVPPGVSGRVVAAADGVVRAIRDGEADRSFRAPFAPRPDRACGNAVVIDHPGGLATAYCHLARGSVRVAAGERVARGTPLGEVGASGMTEFRHVQLSVLRDGREIDPFTGRAVGSGCGPGAPLWTPETTAALAAAGRTKVLAVGFDDGPVTLPEIEDGVTATAIGPEAEAFVAWGVAIGTEAGDVLNLTLTGPGGTLEDSGTEERPRAQAMRFVGRRLREPLPPGAYTARLVVERSGRAVASGEATLTVP